tara:strand:- start:6371 stop:6505 length:135 start_codon:yes stop_codon:yes gene_type:complete
MTHLEGFAWVLWSLLVEERIRRLLRCSANRLSWHLQIPTRFEQW